MDDDFLILWAISNDTIRDLWMTLFVKEGESRAFMVSLRCCVVWNFIQKFSINIQILLMIQ